MITCRLLGPFEVFDSSGNEVDIKGNKNRALLAYLARSQRFSRSREHLTGLLWGDKPDDKARHSLREAVRVLRQELGDGMLNSDGDRLELAAEFMRLDVQELEKLHAVGDWKEAAAIVRGDFLEGLTVKGAWFFEDWLATERAFWRGKCLVALTNRTDELLAAGHTREAVELAERALELDSMSGTAIRAVMKSAALASDRSQALTMYESYLERLNDASTQPDRETMELACQIEKERSWQIPTTLEKSEGAASRRTPLVGRASELTELVTALERSRGDNTATACLVVGDSGTGKTRLAEELLARARLSGATAATFRAVAGDTDLPGTGLLGLARSGLENAPGLAAASPNSLGAFAAEIPEWADRFGFAKGKTPPLEAAIIEVVRAISTDHQVVLLVDDAQWCDQATLLALTAVLRDLADSPVAVCLFFAPVPEREQLDDLQSHIGRDFPGSTIRLEQLDESALRELAAWALPDYTSEEVDRLTRRVALDSAGLPLLAVELLHAVAVGMNLDDTNGVWPRPLRTLSQTLPGDLPDAIVGAIRVGFRRLTKNAQKVLAAASVIDNPVQAEVLSRTTNLAGEELHAALDELEWQHWLAADVRGYTFVAQIVRQVVTRDMITDGQKHRILDAVE